MPGRFDHLPAALLGGLILFASWSDLLWLLAAAAVLALALAVMGAVRRRRVGAAPHQRYAQRGGLGWGYAGIFVFAVAAAFWLPMLSEPQTWPTWLRVTASIALALGICVAGQIWLRARARLVGSPEGAWPSKPTTTSDAFVDPLGPSIADLLSRTQTMRADALAEDLGIPMDELCPRLDGLIGQGLVSRRPKDHGPVQDGHWLHLTFRGEEELAAALAPSARRPAGASDQDGAWA